MAWFLIAALFLASTAINIVLSRQATSKIGKPEPIAPPRAPAGTPIPVLFGTVKIEPMIVAFKLDSVDKYTRAAGLFGLQDQFLGWTHTVSYVALLGWGPIHDWKDLLFDETKLLTDETTTYKTAALPSGYTINSQYVYTTQSRGTPTIPYVNLYLPQIFGGKPPEGQGELASGRNDWIGAAHVGGDFYLLPGTDQGPYISKSLDEYVNAYAGASQPFSFAIQPAYPRFAIGALDWVDLGLSNSLHKIEWIVASDLGGNLIGDDANPVGVLTMILTNSEWGLGIPQSLIDGNNFFNVSVSLGSLGEAFGISGILNQQKPADEYINEVLKTVDAALYRAPDTGLLSLQLVRGGYTVSNLPTLDETNVKALEWNRRDVADTVNQVTVTFTDRNYMFEQNAVTLTDHANVFATGGVRQVTLDFPFVSTEANAIKVGARELKERTLPLGSGTVVTDRSSWDGVPGDVFSLSWSRYGIVDLPVRVLSVAYGTLEDGSIEIEIVEDAFGWPDVPYSVSEAPPTDTTGASRTNDAPQVTPVTAQDATTGSLTLLVLDTGTRVTAVEFSTQSGNTTASGYSPVASPPYTANVTLDPAFPSYIYWRVLYDDASSVSQTISGQVSFTVSPSAPGSTSGQQIVINDGSGGFDPVFDSTAQEVVA